jgi:hypothetical protein
MPTTRARFIVNSRGKRTNSLGYAKVDCHTCTALNRACDRQRPRCGQCLTQRQRCGGFATNLIWKDVALRQSNDVPHREGSRHVKVVPGDHLEGSGKRGRDFRFVRGRMKRKRQPKTHPLVSGHVEGAKELQSSRSGSPLYDSSSLDFQRQTPVQNGPDHARSLRYQGSGACNDEEVVSVDDLGEFHRRMRKLLSLHAYHNLELDADSHLWHEETTAHPWLEPYTSVPGGIPSSLDFEGDLATDISAHGTGDAEDSEVECLPGDDWACPLAQSHLAAEASTSKYDGRDETSDFSVRLAPLMRFRDAAQRYQPVLAMCKSMLAFSLETCLTTKKDDREFCMIPLTMDSPSNPYRIRPDSAGRSDFLLHAILALSSQHLAKKTNQVALSLQAQDHREIAMQSFTQALCRSDPCRLLDALLILVSLDVSRCSTP